MTIKNTVRIPGLLFLAAVLCTGMSLSQNAANGDGILEAADGMGLKEFSTAVEGAGLDGILNNQGVLIFGKGAFIVFAPSDEAFAAASALGLDSRALQESPSELRRLVAHHLVWNNGSMGNISEISTAKSIQGESLTIGHIPGFAVEGANVTATIGYGSGTIYVIDRVLLPKEESSLGAAQAVRDLGAEKFAKAMESSGLEETLSGQGLMGIGGLTSGPYTVFAPSDEAMQAAGDALKAIGQKESGMLSLLSYHVVDAQGLINITESNSVKTMYGASLAVDQNSSLVGGSAILASERYDNGIVYVIDRVLVPISLSM